MSSTARLTTAEFDRLESLLKADRLQESMRDGVALVMARHDGRWVAGARPLGSTR